MSKPNNYELAIKVLKEERDRIESVIDTYSKPRWIDRYYITSFMENLKMEVIHLEKKTQTLCSHGDPDNPSIVICLGHVTSDVFNKAFKSEGWGDEGEWIDEDLTWGYATFDKKGYFVKGKGDPYTWVDWG